MARKSRLSDLISELETLIDDCHVDEGPGGNNQMSVDAAQKKLRELKDCADDIEVTVAGVEVAISDVKDRL